MFKMILLYSILLFSVINVSCQQLPTATNEDLQLQIYQQNAKIAEQSTKFAEQDIKILEQLIQIKDLEIKIAEIENEECRQQQPSSAISSTAGSIFTRWGRRDCPINVSQLVYSGVTGGSYYSHTGAAAEYVCLPSDPTYNANKNFNGPNWGYMYGTSYRNIPDQSLRHFKVPCAVCRTNQFSTVLMIPARTECNEGWQKAYNGELVTGYYNYAAASQYVCLDTNPQINGTDTNISGKFMYPVRAKCGALPCPPYEENTLLTCVVCLK